MKESIICAGFGGQGVMLLGKILAQAALKEGKHLTWIPSYGAAMRGGASFCMVIISDKPIASPFIDKCDTLFVFNQPSWDRFKDKVKTGGLIILNSSLIKKPGTLPKARICKVACTDIASSLGNVRVANMVALGAYLKQKKILRAQVVSKVFAEIAPSNKKHLVEINRKALISA